MIGDELLELGQTAISASTPAASPVAVDQLYRFLNSSTKKGYGAPDPNIKLVVKVDSAFANPAVPANGCEVSLASIAGPTLTQAATSTASTDLITFAGSGDFNGASDIPPGTPFEVSAVGTSGLSTGVVYYARPSGAGFYVETSLAAALSGANSTIPPTGAALTDGTPTIRWMPTIHGSSGFQSSITLPAAAQLTIGCNRLWGQFSGSGAIAAQFPAAEYRDSGVFGAGVVGTGVNLHAPVAQRFVVAYYRPSATTSGTCTARLVLDSGNDARQYHPSAIDVR